MIGVCQKILEGDAFVFRTQSESPEKAHEVVKVALYGVRTPHINDLEAAGWAAREVARNLLIGQECTLTVVGNGSGDELWARVDVKGEDVGVAMVKAGFGRPDSEDAEYLKMLQAAEASAIAEGKGVHGSTTFDQRPSKDEVREPLKANTEVECLVEEINNALHLLCYLPSENSYAHVSLAGIRIAPGKLAEASEFVEQRILQRLLRLRVDAVVDGRVYATLLHPLRGSIAVHLLKAGLAEVDSESSKHLKLSAKQSLQVAMAEAKLQTPSRASGTGAREVTPETVASGKKESGSVGAPQSEFTWPGKRFKARLVDIHGGSCITVLRPRNLEMTTVSVSDVAHVLYLSSIRGDRGGWLSASRLCMVNLCGTDLLDVTIDYVGYPPETDAPDIPRRLSDDYGRMHFATVENAKTQKCLNVELVRIGCARPERSRNATANRSCKYDEILDAHSPDTVPPTAKSVNDYVGPANSKRAQQLFVSLAREKNIAVVIERAVTGSRYRAFIPNYTAVVSLSLSGVMSPRTDEPGFEEALIWGQLNLLFRRFQATFLHCDNTGTFSTVLSSKTECINEQLLSTGYGMVHPRSPHPENYEAIEAKAIAEQKGLWKSEDRLAYYGKTSNQQQETSMLGEWGSCTICHCEDAFVYVQKHDNDNLNTVARLIENEEIRPCDEVPTKNSIVLAKYEGEWYRGRVTSVQPKTGLMVVFFVDYGNTSEVLAGGNWAVLPPAVNLIAYPPCTTKVQLAYIKCPSTDTDNQMYACDAVMEFGESGSSKLECVAIEGGIAQVLLTNRGGVLLNDELVMRGLSKVKRLPKDKCADPVVKQLLASESAARQKRIGIWVYGDVGDTDDELY